MNKKGFTLVEVIVAITLLAIIGVTLAVSLNRSFKDNTVSSYNEFVDKVKSSAMLYVNNEADIVNSLNEDSYKIIKVKDLIENGYINDKLKNPDTGDKINPEDKIKVSYNNDKELTIEYPYNNNYKEPYLYTLNYTTTYKSAEEDICYKGLNTTSLQLVNENGAKVHDLVRNVSIKAYMEDGSSCTSNKINTSKLGTHKIRYDYTPDASDINTSNNVKSADRTITINPSKPIIDIFKIVPTDSNNIYKAKMDLDVSDVSDLKLRYCIVGFSSEESNNISDNGIITKCSDTPRVVNGVTQLNNVWMDLNYSSSKGKFSDTRNFDISTEMSDFKDNSEVIFYVLVRNSFEEYSTKKNEYNNGIYLLSSQVIFNLTSDAYFNGIQKTSDNKYIIKNIKNNTPFNSFMNSYSNYQRVYRPKYYFTGWSKTENSSTPEYTVSSTTPILGILNLYPVWEVDTTAPSCKLSLNGSSIVATVSDNKSNNLAYYGWSSSYSGYNSTSIGISTGTTRYYAKDFAQNIASCSINITNVTRTTTKNCHNVATICASSRDCDPAGSCCRWDWSNGVKTVCEDGPTTISCPGGYTQYGDYCYSY